MISLVELEKYCQDGLLQKQNHPDLDLTIWNYTPRVQYEKLWDEITTQCRGLVTNSNGDIVARPFKKFFNYEEHTPQDIPQENYVVYEKLDGSLGILFNYKNNWVLATRGSFTSPQAIKGYEILKKYRYELLPKDITYLFEIIYPENRIVVDYGNDEKLIMIGAIQTNDGCEIDIHYEDYNLLDFDLVTIYKTWGEGYDLLKEEISKNKEGYVIRFKNGFRMKIKGEEYKRLHRIITNVSNRDIWEYLKEDKPLDELLDRVPDEFYNWVKDTSESLKKQFFEIESEYRLSFLRIMIKDNNIDKKSFAELAKTHKHSSILFSLYNNKDYKKIIWKLIYPKYSKPFKKHED